MQTTKKKPSLIFILVGAVLAGYLGYLINGAWTEGIAFNEFMDRFNEVCAVPFANYYNSNTVKGILRGKSLNGRIPSQTECCIGHIHRSRKKR